MISVRASAGLLLLAAVMAGCGAPADRPLIQTVGPATFIPGRTSLLVVTGQGFREGALVTLGGSIQADRSVWVNASYMTAVLPAAIGPAQYSVEVTNPDGQRAVSSVRLT